MSYSTAIGEFIEVMNYTLKIGNVWFKVNYREDRITVFWMPDATHRRTEVVSLMDLARSNDFGEFVSSLSAEMMARYQTETREETKYLTP